MNIRYLLIFFILSAPTISYAGFFYEVAKGVAVTVLSEVITSGVTASEDVPQQISKIETTNGTQDDMRRIRLIIKNLVDQSTPLTDRIGLYATAVDYFSAGVVDHKFIQKDRKKFEKKWTEIKYNIISVDEIAVSSDRKYAAARYTLEYFVKWGDKQRSGTSEVAILIGSLNSQPRIYSIKEWVHSD